ncbi:hypothetical protein Sya03_11690 [Spirilliplanes yamanashiensis]|uniref:Histidine kinase/HSP90-like ATPase domain-containing protein n=1 Tax=Spirilliplanes yamanashiensis TaxID=42233 RepID=A0A8J3Y5N7_9ACTN|nr:anti-sigma regulatory factor (Ser/Thr protein kinase) [Spirilliplanes yamanashiensis]GIJ01817.1 hypothetical protein Sya03_11690 [Spirilliplanes yamanashiensis]
MRDTGAWIQPPADQPPGLPGRGRGRLMMEALMDETEVRSGPGGTTVRLVKELADDA